jgi:peroxiredoxin
LYEEHRKDGLVTVAITNETPEKARAYLQENPVPFPVLYDPSMKAASAYEVQGIPVTCLVDREGKLINKIQGFTPEMFGNDFVPSVKKALES